MIPKAHELTLGDGSAGVKIQRPTATHDWEDTPVTFDEFTLQLTSEFDLSHPLNPDALLMDDLGLDSLDCFNLVLFLEELAGVTSELQPLPYPVLITVSDAFSYFQEAKRLHVQAEPSGSEALQ